MNPELQLMQETTTERIIPGHYQSTPVDRLIYLFHTAAYDFALPYAKHAAVLDYGCGSGYGAASLAPHCREITAIDISAEAIALAEGAYKAPNLKYHHVRPSSEQPIPFDAKSFDVVLSFQVIEHIDDPNVYLADISRVLKPGGVAIFATPDRTTRLFSFQRPWNRWHVTEYSQDSLGDLLRSHFEEVDVLKMGGDPKLLHPEYLRTRRMRWICLPFTLPFLPDRVRLAGLGFLKKLLKPRPFAVDRGQETEISTQGLVIASDLDRGTNLIAVARRRETAAPGD